MRIVYYHEWCYLMRMLPVASTRRTNASAGHLQLVLLVVGLVWQEHSDLAPAVEEQADGAGPHE